MATTSPNNISYPTNADAQKTIEQRIQDTATSTQLALNTKANTSHSHSTADITSGALDFNRLPSGSVIQVGGVNTTNTLAGTLSGAVLTSFSYAPKLSNSKLLLQSSAVVVGEYNNIDNEFYMAAYRDGNLITLSRQTAGHFHFSSSLNVGWMSFNHYFTSWGTNSANIEIKIGNNAGMYASYPYYTNTFTNGTAGFSIIEFMP